MNRHVLSLLLLVAGCQLINACAAEGSEAPSGVIAQTQWDVGPLLICTVTELHGEALPERVFEIRRGEATLIRESDYARLIAMFPLRDVGGGLVTVWQSASSYHIRMYSFLDGKLTVSLDAYSWSFPELFDVDNDGAPDIVLRDRVEDSRATDIERRLGESVRAYKWSDSAKQYRLLWKRAPASVRLK